jgi:methylated-DNA-protein-cysteine methyltransferase related protein
MPKSAAFIQIKQGVLEITSKIPVGHVTTYAAIGEHLNVIARHVAYILATLNIEEKLELPWYRVVAENGAISSGKFNSRHHAQVESLKEEGFQFTNKNHVDNFVELFCSPDSLVSWDRSNEYYLKDRSLDN